MIHLVFNLDWFGCRHVFALMGFLGLASVYMMRINLSVAIVDMVKTEPTAGHSSNQFDHPSLFFADFHPLDATSDSNDTLQCEDNSENGGQVLIDWIAIIQPIEFFDSFNICVLNNE